MIELVATPVSVSLSPAKVAPSAVITISDGSTSVFAEVEPPIIFCSGMFCGCVVDSWANASPGAQSRPANVISTRTLL
jgi:hypothetical protein